MIEYTAAALGTNKARAFLTRQLDEQKTPGVSYAFFNANEVLWSFEGGVADVASGRKIDAGTTFHGYSTTKTFTALAVLGLADRRLLALDEPVQRYLPDFIYGADITVRQLLNHSSGLPNPIPLRWIHLAAEDSSFDDRAFFTRVMAENPRVRSAPNEKFAYSNLNYIVLGWLIENLSGLSFRQYIREHIVAPLGLGAADLDFTIVDPARHATGYHRRFTFSSFLLGFMLDKKKFMGPPQGKWRPFRPFYVNGSAYGGLIGTKNAFVRYAQALLQYNSPIVSQPGRTALFTENRTLGGRSTGMALAWWKGELDHRIYFAHAGGGGGYYCEVRVYPEDAFGSVILFNRTGMTDEHILDDVDELMLEGL